MTSRNALAPQLDRCRRALVAALDAEEENTHLVAERTRRLLRWNPHGSDRMAWLRSVLPQEGHYERAMAALNEMTGPVGARELAALDAAEEEQRGGGRRRR